VVRITVNGKERDIADGSSIGDLVASLGFGDKHVVVERNGEAVERARFANVVLGPRDVLEVVRPVQGGAW
jgi:sulfur carrier protein